MQPLDPWEAYYRQLAVHRSGRRAAASCVWRRDPAWFSRRPRTRVRQFRDVWESAAATCLVQPAWSRAPIPVSWSAVHMLWRTPATVIPLSFFAPQAGCAARRLGSSWKWQVNRNVAGGELRSGGDRVSLGFRRPCAQRNGLPLAGVRADFPLRAGHRRRRRRLGVRRGQNLSQRGVPHARVPEQTACRFTSGGFHVATSPWPPADGQPGNWCWSWRTVAMPAGRPPPRWTSAITPTGSSRP